jgi:hypothetical protein
MKADRFLLEVIPKIQDLSGWKHRFQTGKPHAPDSFEISGFGRVVVGDGRSDKASLLVRIAFDRNASGVNVVGVVDTNVAEPAVAKLKGGIWSEDIVASMVIACVLFHGLSRNDLSWAFQQIPSGKANRLKALQQGVLKCLVSMREHKIKHPKYPQVVYNGVKDLHTRFRLFPNDDVKNWLDNTKKLFKNLEGAGINEEQIIDLWRESIVARIMES